MKFYDNPSFILDELIKVTSIEPSKLESITHSLSNLFTADEFKSFNGFQFLERIAKVFMYSNDLKDEFDWFLGAYENDGEFYCELENEQFPISLLFPE